MANSKMYYHVCVLEVTKDTIDMKKEKNKNKSKNTVFC